MSGQTNLNVRGEVASVTITVGDWGKLSPDYRTVSPGGRRSMLVLCSRCGTVLAPAYEPGEALPEGHAPGTQLRAWEPGPLPTLQGPGR
ncbi:MAG: hypothetical protein Q7T55_19860 [Solirubrobacteraceae bacterium]|nr:hypothetical protein [Solirubrobacteraceae bacterium]